MNNFYISSFIKDLRKEYGYTLQDVAKLLNVSKAAVSKWENGDDIGIEHLYDMSKLFNVTVKEIISGKRDKETNEDYWRRNYDLSNFKFSNEINNKNIEDVKEFFKRIKLIKETFFKLLPRWANNELNESEFNGFNYIKEYFIFNKDYYTYKKFGPNYISFVSISDEKAFTKETVDKHIKEKTIYLKWELSKLYLFNYKIIPEVFLKSNNAKVYEYLVDTYDQIEKDILLEKNLPKNDKANNVLYQKNETARKKLEDEIEFNPFLKVLINYGANVLIRYDIADLTLDQEAFKKIEGNTFKMNNVFYEKINNFDFSGIYKFDILKKWEFYSYEEYKSMIDYRKTDHLKDIVNLKDKNPKKYIKKYKAYLLYL